MSKAKRREGLVVRFFRACSGVFSRAVSKGALGRFFTGFDRAQEQYLHSLTGHRLEGKRGKGGVHRAVRRNIAAALADHPLLRGIRWLLARLAASGMRSVGLFFLTAGTYSAIMYWLADKVWGNHFVSPANAAVGIASMLIGVLLLFSDVSLGWGIRHSSICRSAFFLLGLTGDSLREIPRQGKTDYVMAVPLGMAVGALSALTGPFWVVAGAVALIVIYLVFAVPEAGVLLLLMFLPFAGFLPHSTVWVALAVFLPLAGYLGKLLCGNRALHLGLQDLPIVLMLPLFFFSGISAAGSGAWQGALLWVLFVLAYFPVANALGTKEWATRCKIGFLFSAAVCSATGILQFILTAVSTHGMTAREIGATVHGGFSGTTAFAYFLVIAFPFALSAFYDGTRTARSLAGAACLLILGAATLTFVTAAWFTLLLTALTFLLLRRSRAWPSLLVSGSVLAVAIAILPAAWRRAIRDFFPEPYAVGRGTFAATVKNVFFSHGQGIFAARAGIGRLLFGLGHDGAQVAYPLFASGGVPLPMENCDFWLFLLLENGVIGVLLPVAMLLLLMRNGFTALARRGAGAKPAMAATAITFAAATAFFGCFRYAWSDPAAMSTFFALAGLLTATLRQEEDEVRRSRANDEIPTSGTYAECDISLDKGDAI